MMFLPLPPPIRSFARTFRRMPFPPITAPPGTVQPILPLLEVFSLYQLQGQSNLLPLLYTRPATTLPAHLYEIDTTLAHTRRPYTHHVYVASRTHDGDPFYLSRHWLRPTPAGLDAVTFLEHAPSPTDPAWERYWYVIHGCHSAPPPAFWTAPPQTIQQTPQGILEYLA
jgi:hypothetical protein